MSPQVTLRRWCMDDADILAKHADNPRIAACLRDVFPHPYSLEDAQCYLGMVLRAEGDLFRAIQFEGVLCGAVGLMAGTDIYQKSAECGYWLAEPFWGRGIMTEAVRQVVTLGFGTMDVVRIFARPFSFNRSSQRVLEKVGFGHEATLRMACFKNGQYWDEWVYALLRDEWLKKKEQTAVGRE